MATGPVFDGVFRDKLYELFRWRRDVRRFRADPIPEILLQEILHTAVWAPSVGLSEPWRFVLVQDARRRQEMRKNFLQANDQALTGYQGERAKLYASLKLEGLDQAPIHLGVFCEQSTQQGHGLGRRTMPETLAYSVVAAIQILWLTARANNVGLGWISILDPDGVKTILEVPSSWNLVAYLCVGYPEEEKIEPELSAAGWEHRRDGGDFLIKR